MLRPIKGSHAAEISKSNESLRGQSLKVIIRYQIVLKLIECCE
jgi:hypothetical protein